MTGSRWGICEGRHGVGGGGVRGRAKVSLWAELRLREKPLGTTWSARAGHADGTSLRVILLDRQPRSQTWGASRSLTAKICRHGFWTSIRPAPVLPTKFSRYAADALVGRGEFGLLGAVEAGQLPVSISSCCASRRSSGSLAKVWCNLTTRATCSHQVEHLAAELFGITLGHGHGFFDECRDQKSSKPTPCNPGHITPDLGKRKMQVCRTNRRPVRAAQVLAVCDDAPELATVQGRR